MDSGTSGTEVLGSGMLGSRGPRSLSLKSLPGPRSRKPLPGPLSPKPLPGPLSSGPLSPGLLSSGSLSPGPLRPKPLEPASASAPSFVRVPLKMILWFSSSAPFVSRLRSVTLPSSFLRASWGRVNRVRDIMVRMFSNVTSGEVPLPVESSRQRPFDYFSTALGPDCFHIGSKVILWCEI